MTKSKKTAKASKTKGKKSKPEQLKIAGTGRIDANEAIETQADVFNLAREAASEAHDEMVVEQDKLTKVLKDNKLTSYVYVDADGVKREAYIPAEAKAKLRLVKPKKDVDGDGE